MTTDAFDGRRRLDVGTRAGSGLVARVASAAVLLPLVVLVVWLGALPLALAAAAVSGRTCFELLRLLRGKVSALEWVAISVAALLSLLPVLVPSAPWTYALGLLVSMNIVVWSWLTLRADIEQGPARVSAILFASLVSGVALFTIVQVRSLSQGREWLLCLLVATWMNDTCAYFGGRTMGRHRLAPRVSPGKTWEGFAFGALGTFMAVGVAVSFGLAPMGIVDAAVLASCVSILGPLGDLSKSLLKRARGVKDAGNLIPGHGGLLDRIDSMLFTSPAVLAYLLLSR